MFYRTLVKLSRFLPLFALLGRARLFSSMDMPPAAALPLRLQAQPPGAAPVSSGVGSRAHSSPALPLHPCSDIKRLWKAAGQRYGAPKQQQAATVGPEFSIWRDLPAEPGQLALFAGKAALPTHVLGISSFSKAFFLHPATEQLYGRVLLGKGPLGDVLYPLYFKASVGPSVVPSECLAALVPARVPGPAACPLLAEARPGPLAVTPERQRSLGPTPH